ncbi:MAG: hypothetical protein ABIH70_01045 [Chloroflexota bacterium]
MEADERIREAIKRTQIVRLPKQSLYTFGITTINYYLVTEPVYTEVGKDVDETVVREGKVIAERPRIVTPYYLTQLEGFSSEARRYFESLRQEQGSVPGLFYTYKNEPKELNIVADCWLAVVDRLNTEIDKHGDRLAAIIKGEDELWDVSLLKFIYEMTRHSLKDNITQLGSRGLLDMDASGVPSDARLRIEDLFARVERGELAPGELKEELDRWGLFAEYEDRFLNIFKRRG